VIPRFRKIFGYALICLVAVAAVPWHMQLGATYHPSPPDKWLIHWSTVSCHAIPVLAILATVFVLDSFFRVQKDSISRRRLLLWLFPSFAYLAFSSITYFRMLQCGLTLRQFFQFMPPLWTSAYYLGLPFMYAWIIGGVVWGLSDRLGPSRFPGEVVEKTVLGFAAVFGCLFSALGLTIFDLLPKCP